MTNSVEQIHSTRPRAQDAQQAVFDGIRRQGANKSHRKNNKRLVENVPLRYKMHKNKKYPKDVP